MSLIARRDPLPTSGPIPWSPVTDTTAPITSPPGTVAETTKRAERTFSISLFVSAVRCTLTYVLIPWVFPVLGVASGVGPVLGLVIGSAAIVANIVSIRRFHRADHRWKWPMTAVNGGIMVLLVILVIVDATSL